MSFCQKCGLENPDSSKFCSRCGKRLVTGTLLNSGNEVKQNQYKTRSNENNELREK